MQQKHPPGKIWRVTTPVLLAILSLSWPVRYSSGIRVSAKCSCLRVLSRSPENSALRGLFDGCPASGAQPEPLTKSRKALMISIIGKSINLSPLKLKLPSSC